MDPVFQYTAESLMGRELRDSDSIDRALSGLPLRPDDKWWFWDETWTDAYGPYDSREDADAACAKYAREMLG